MSSEVPVLEETRREEVLVEEKYECVLETGDSSDCRKYYYRVFIEKYTIGHVLPKSLYLFCRIKSS